MVTNMVGAFVTHAKLSDLGSGEVLAADKGTLRVRFASGERVFLLEAALPHLTLTAEAPASARAAATKATKKPKAPKKGA